MAMVENNYSNYSIRTFIINMKDRCDRRENIVKEFQGKEEFDLDIIDACTHNVGAIGLWKSILKILEIAIRDDEDVILICEDDHSFTPDYEREYFFRNIVEAHSQGADVLAGGIGGFGYAVPIATNRFWVDYFCCTQFIVLYKKYFKQLMDYTFKDCDTADGVISMQSTNTMVLYPFISIQKDFGYSDITKDLMDNPGLITHIFKMADSRLSNIKAVSDYYAKF